MTISTAYAALTYNGDGATTSFAVTWPFFSGTLRVTAIDADGVETVKTITTHYTVAGGTDGDGLPATGTVTMLSAPASGTTLRIERRTTKTQSSSWTNAGPYQAKTLESALDKLTLLAQEGISGGSGGGSPGSGDALTLDTSGATDFWDGAGYILSDLADPVSDQDAATKAYVDDYIDTVAALDASAAASASAASGSEASAAASSVAASDSADEAAASAVLASGSATSAASSATNASDSATAASTSAGVAVASAGFQFVFDNPTTMADPGAGVVRFNHATLASVTAIAIDDLAADTGNPDVSPWVLTWDDSTNTTKGLLRLRKASAASTYVDFNVTGLTDNAGWSQIAVTYVGSSGTISDGDSLIVTFAPIGNKGLDGAGAGDVVGPASSVDGEIAIFSGTTGKVIKRITETSGTNNAIGYQALYSNTTGYRNAALGYQALRSNTTGISNNALGWLALYSNTTGNHNTALGQQALYSNTTGNHNNAIGYLALNSNTTGYYNNAIGYQALLYSQTGIGNLAIGYRSGGYGTGVAFTGADYNTIIGYEAGYNLGQDDDKNIYIGYQAGYSETGSNKLYIASGDNTALIYGDLSTGVLELGGTTAHTGGKIRIDASGNVRFPAIVSGLLKADASGYLSSEAAASAAEVRAGTATKYVNVANAYSALDLVTLTDAATISVDMSTFLNATVTLAGNRTLGSPTNEKVGQSGVIYIVQDATGSRTLAYGSDWKFAGGTAPTLTTTANAVDALFYTVRATDFVVANLIKDVK